MNMFRKKLRKGIGSVCLVDWCLILFMIILLAYIGFTLFSNNGTTTEENNTIDIIVQTSAAGILGYFISGNFAKSKSNPGSQKQNFSNNPVGINLENTSEHSAQNRIGFAGEENPAIAEGSGTMKVGNIVTVDNTLDPDTDICNSVQVIVVSAIGILSLLFLFMARSDITLTPGITATMSQFRDFVSACVGFLISCGKK